MEKEFVPYELAIELNNLGIKLPFVFNYYSTITRKIRHNQEKSGLRHHIVAPLWQQAFDWFMTENNIIVVIDRSFGYSYSIHKDTHQFEIIEKEGTFGSYEDARLACLKKLIEINDKS